MNEDNKLVRRGLKLGRLGASLTGSYLAYQVQNLMQGADTAEDRRQAFQKLASKRVRSELASLKGPVMKFGQVLSMMGHALPQEALTELALLQGQAPGMHPTLARAQFKASCGAAPEDVFAEFEPKPFAAASLGQVHRAKAKDGEPLAVKIQYPGIRTAIENDFKLLRSASLPGRMSGHVSKDLIAEVERGFLLETDYHQEAANLKHFAEALSPLRYLEVPRVREDLSTDRVLAMSMLSGVSMEAYLGAKPNRKMRNLVGGRLMEIYHFELRVVRGFHADPHPGNYLFRDDGTIGMVDFGCVKHCSDGLCELVTLLVDGEWKRSSKHFPRLARLICGNERQARSAQGKQLAHTGIDLYQKLFPTHTPGEQTVDFGDKSFLVALTDMWNEAIRSKITNPEYAFASRAELGLCNLLHRFGARLDTAALMGRVTDYLAGNRAQLD